MGLSCDEFKHDWVVHAGETEIPLVGGRKGDPLKNTRVKIWMKLFPGKSRAFGNSVENQFSFMYSLKYQTLFLVQMFYNHGLRFDWHNFLLTNNSIFSVFSFFCLFID